MPGTSQRSRSRLRAARRGAPLPARPVAELGTTGRWRGTAKDVELLNQLPDLRSLTIDLSVFTTDDFAGLTLPRLEKLSLKGVSDQALKAW